MTVRVALGPVAAIPDHECVAVADGAAVAVRVGDDVCVYRNRCLHQESPLAGGWVRDGVLSCPLHFWRYRAGDGRLIGTQRSLERYRVTIVDGEAYADLPEPERPTSLREQLLARARDYDRATAYDTAHRDDA